MQRWHYFRLGHDLTSPAYGYSMLILHVCWLISYTKNNRIELGSYTVVVSRDGVVVPDVLGSARRQNLSDGVSSLDCSAWQKLLQSLSEAQISVN